MALGLTSLTLTRGDKSPSNSKRGYYGIPAAAAACAANTRFLITCRPETPLRACALIAIETILRGRGRLLKSESRQTLIAAMELGALLNDRLDGDPYEINALRAAAARFSKSEHREIIRSYIAGLRCFEHERPDCQDEITTIALYRERVNHISLAMLWAIASNTSFESARDEILHSSDLNLLFRMVMQCQLIDDAMDLRKDLLKNLPSFATARNGPEKSIRKFPTIYGYIKYRICSDDYLLWCVLKLMTACSHVVIFIFGRGIGFKEHMNVPNGRWHKIGFEEGIG
jgi:hypothetical protein